MFMFSLAFSIFDFVYVTNVFDFGPTSLSATEPDSNCYQASIEKIQRTRTAEDVYGINKMLMES